MADQQQTVSRVLMTSDIAKAQRELLHKWCEWAAERGGSFAIRQEWTESQWFSTYTINWPAGTAALSSSDGETVSRPLSSKETR